MTRAAGTTSALSRNGASPGFPGTTTSTALLLPDALEFERWQGVGNTLLSIGRAAMWWVGDWYLFGERRYGEQAAQAVGDETGYSARTVQQAAWVAGRFPPSSRLENVDFGTHMALAGVEDPATRGALLERAAAQTWTRRQAREAVRAFKRGGAAVTRVPGDQTVETARLVLAWYPETGLLVIQDRAGHGVTIAADDLTSEARGLLRNVLRHRGGRDVR